MASKAVAALAVTDELALPLRAVGDLAATAGVSREEVVVITQCTSLGNTPSQAPLSPNPKLMMRSQFSWDRTIWIQVCGIHCKSMHTQVKLVVTRLVYPLFKLLGFLSSESPAPAAAAMPASRAAALPPAPASRSLTPPPRHGLVRGKKHANETKKVAMAGLVHHSFNFRAHQVKGAKVLEMCLYLLIVLSVEGYIVIGVILYGYIVIGGM
ncbi:hypothetical protein VPH35_056289 [Triticum aestivum]|uniref:Uncharacterized protein n=1 Tax=Triticum aestivum TaxID=4565 RepID=A0A080YTP8_WHEAT|nr:unnamed protein product [Triticum aestivum]